MQRFNNLEDVYNTLVAINFDFNTLPTTNKYRKYKEWKTNPEQRQLPEGSAQNTGRRSIVSINPFGLAYDPDSVLKVRMSGRAHTALANIGAAALYNHVAVTAAHQFRPGFVPAKAILAANLSTPQTVAASSNRITGRAYRRRTGETYTIPFGAADANDREFSVQEEILTNTNTANYSKTFTPERLYQI